MRVLIWQVLFVKQKVLWSKTTQEEGSSRFTFEKKQSDISKGPKSNVCGVLVFYLEQNKFGTITNFHGGPYIF